MSSPVMDPVSAKPVVGGGRICFRGDTREPNVMFKNGFHSREGESTSIRYRSVGLGSGDIDPPSAVCITPRFAMAPLFPIDLTVTDLWIYAVYARQVYNTHAQQYADGMKAIKHEIKTNPSGDLDNYAETNALWPLFAQEVATKLVAAEDVMCALKCKRIWASQDIFDGCTYTLDKSSLIWNDLCGVDATITSAVTEFLNKEPNSGTTPSRASGFHKA